MAHSEKLSIKWDDSYQNRVGSFQNMRSDTEFADVTLVTEGDHQIEAHRIILSDGSPFFKTVLKRNKHSHPLIYMSGVNTRDLVSIVDFLYHEEAIVFQEDLDGFLALAEDLQIENLASYQSETLEEKKETSEKSKILKPTMKDSPEHEIATNSFKIDLDEVFKESKNKSKDLSSTDSLVMSVYGDLTKEDIEAKKMSMIERVVDGISNWRCSVCGKTTIKGSKIQEMKRHTETHLEGALYPCSQCGKVSRTSNGLLVHISKHHKI